MKESIRRSQQQYEQLSGLFSLERFSGYSFTVFQQAQRTQAEHLQSLWQILLFVGLRQGAHLIRSGGEKRGPVF